MYFSSHRLVPSDAGAFEGRLEGEGDGEKLGRKDMRSDRNGNVIYSHERNGHSPVTHSKQAEMNNETRECLTHCKISEH